MSERDREREVVVTGASRGIGLNICRALMSEGYRVLGVARAATPEWNELAAEAPGRVVFMACDLGTSEGLGLLSRRLRETPSLYGLVNNAGVARSGLHAVMSRNSIDEMVALNLTAPMVLSQSAVKAMQRSRSGRIISITSVAARRPYRGLAAYSATKAALEGFSSVLAAESGPWGVTVNCIAPGFLETRMNASLTDEVRARILRRGMVPGGITTTDVAAVTAFLLSEAAGAVTAEVIRVDGGSAA